jgi:hypothetical protein
LIQLSARAQEVIERIRVKRKAPAGVGLKLVKGTRGELALMLAAVRPGDLAVPSGDSPLLVVDVETASEYRGCTLDVPPERCHDEVPTFVLRSPFSDA